MREHTSFANIVGWAVPTVRTIGGHCPPLTMIHAATYCINGMHSEMNCLNLGYGRRFHPTWTNANILLY